MKCKTPVPNDIYGCCLLLHPHLTTRARLNRFYWNLQLAITAESLWTGVSVKLGKNWWVLPTKTYTSFCAHLERHSLNIYRNEEICPTADADTKAMLNVCPISFSENYRKGPTSVEYRNVHLTWCTIYIKSKKAHGSKFLSCFMSLEIVISLVTI
jgi:hypothetical protein